MQQTRRTRVGGVLDAASCLNASTQREALSGAKELLAECVNKLQSNSGQKAAWTREISAVSIALPPMFLVEVPIRVADAAFDSRSINENELPTARTLDLN